MADLQAQHHEHEPEQHAEHHIVSPMVYAVIFGALLVCTAVTIGASYLEMGAFNPVVAILIAVFLVTSSKLKSGKPAAEVELAAVEQQS